MAASHDWPRDSSIYRIRQFQEQDLQQLRQDERYVYEEEEIVRESPGLWSLINDWLKDLFKELGVEHEQETIDFWSRTLVWLLIGIAFLVVLVFLLRNSKFRSLFKRSDSDYKEALEFLSYSGNNANLEEELGTAEKDENYPLALRLLYIRSLRILEDAMLIAYKKDKTNSEYLAELNMKSQYPFFERLTHWFERVHYGEYEIDAENYAECKTLFAQMRQTLKGGNENG